DLGLPPERLELATKLRGEVGEPGEVGLHGVELAERLLLALAVLEDARRFLDVGAPVLRLRGEHRIELALPHDDVHLPADAGIGEQLLDVEQAAVAAVDLVLARAVAEHAPGDRDLGVVDGERAVGVVDRERDLGPAERRPPRRAREDDVLHLAAAQGLRPLLAQDPADGVDDVGLPRAVRPDHAGDARLEAQRRGRGEGLEALQRQALEVHGEAPGKSRCRERTGRDPRSGLGEAPQAAARRAPALDDLVHPAGAVGSAEGVEQLLTRATTTLRNHCHSTVGEVARLPHQAELQRAASRPPAETYALYPSVYPGGQSDRRFGHTLR